MAGVVGVRFKQACRVYYFDPGAIELHAGDWVVVESVRGQALAQVVIAPGQVILNELAEPLKPVVRKATEEDIQLASDLQLKEREVVLKSSQVVSEMNLPMKVIAAEVNLESNHVTIFFRAEERVDFRDLVKRLSTLLKMRVELRQAGPRDAAKMLGGMGRCGRTLCCATFLTELAPVSIKMAKDQDLPLNPSKISGVCGRLLCCLSYEVDDYRASKAEKQAAARAAAAAAPAAVAAAPEVGAGEEEEEAEGGPAPAGRTPRPGPFRPGQAAQAKAAEAQKVEKLEDQRKRRRPRRRKKKPFVPAATGEQAQGASPSAPVPQAEAQAPEPPASSPA